MVIEIRRRSLLQRIVLLPSTFARHYAISRKYVGRMDSCRIAMAMCRLVIAA